MNKETIRPLLVENLETLREAEETAHWQVSEALREEENVQGVEALARLERAHDGWKAARLARAQAELHLWLADRQWARLEEGELLALEAERNVSSRSSKGKPAE